MGELRWKLADEEGTSSGQTALFNADEVVEHNVGTGEFRGMEFLHVNAQRIINAVPAASRMPFRYTINAYRGCSHACAYCQVGDTAILLADGRHRPLADLQVGDEIYGTEVRGTYRHYVKTVVIAHWETIKSAYRITLADGTELVASGDHRYLTNRGWKHVIGEGRRPSLTLQNHLVGMGQFAPQPEHDADYRTGYRTGRHDGPLPQRPTAQWQKGFLAGIFDAEGSCSQGILRISNTDARIIGAITDALARFNFTWAIEQAPGTNKPVHIVRVTGGLVERLRFFQLTDPAITRKRNIEGEAIKNKADLRVVAVEPLGMELPMYDITTGTGDFIANGVVSHNCFARPTHDYLGLNIGEDFERKIVVKINAVEKVRAELAGRRWAGEPIAMGTNTDPYQRAEGKYHLTQGIVGALIEARNPFSILTKSTLILRDLATLAAGLRAGVDIAVNFSIGTLDESVWKLTEPGTPHPRRRIEAVRKLNDAGIPCGVLVAPIIPGLSDADEQVAEVKAAVRAAGGKVIGTIPLHLRAGVRDHFMGWLAEKRPDMVADYEARFPVRKPRRAKRPPIVVTPGPEQLPLL